jgi:alpha-glucosidase
MRLAVATLPALSALLALALPAARPLAAQTWRVAAPSAPVEAIVRAGATLAIDVRMSGRPVVTADSLGLDVAGRLDPARMPRVTGAARRAVDGVIVAAVPTKRSRIPERYAELRLALGPAYALVVRAYDDGVAYRFETAFPDSLVVRAERATFRFAANDSAWVPVQQCRKDADCWHGSWEENYRHVPLAALPADSLAFPPIVVGTAGGAALLTESDLWDYPGLWLRPVRGQPAVAAAHAPYPLADTIGIGGGEFEQRLVTRRADHIARVAGTRTFPWRAVLLAPDAARLVENDLVYRLARPQQLADASWVRPGKSTEEWITGRVQHGVDFVSGFNTATYRYIIDFAADFGLEYHMFDAGWSDDVDPTKLNPAIDLPALVAHANRRGVGVILWHSAYGLERNLEALLDRYQGWGVKGLMVDFMDRDDQPMVRFYERLARETAKRRLVLNLHGAFKPTGMERAYPHLLTREAVLGHEYDMWSDRVTPDHALTIPFVRMQAGPMDFEGGTMANGTRKGFRVVEERPMSQGTRAQQAAQYVVYESPLQYLAASASDYRAEPAFTRLLVSVPTVWDETRVLGGAVGDSLVLARRRGREWWIAAMTDWTPRTLAIPLDFLGGGRWDATLVEDGANADRHAADHVLREAVLDAAGSRPTLRARLAPGGGFVARLRPRSGG